MTSAQDYGHRSGGEALVTVNTVGGYGVVLENIEPTLKAIKTLAPDLDKEMKARFKEVGNRIIAEARGNVPNESPLSNWARDPIGDPNWRAKWKADERDLRNRAGGFPRFEPGRVRSGMKASIKKPKAAKFGALLYLVNMDPAGAIYELAGRGKHKSGTTGRPGTGGPNFIKVLNGEDQASRLIWAAYDDFGRNRVQEELIEAVAYAEEELNRRFGGEGFTETRS